MPLAMSRPWKHPNSGVFWLRKGVPEDLRKLASAAGVTRRVMGGLVRVAELEVKRACVPPHRMSADEGHTSRAARSYGRLLTSTG